MNKSIIFGLLMSFSTAGFAVIKRDTIIEGVKYNTIERYQGGKGSVARICNMEMVEGVNRLHGPAILYHQFPSGAIAAIGAYFIDCENGFWRYYYPNGEIEMSGKYTPVNTKKEIREAGGDKIYYSYEPFEEPGWKYWDEWGNRISKVEHKTVNHKLTLKLAIQDYEQKKLRCEGDTNCENRINYYKKVYKKKYRGEVFWSDTLAMGDGPIVYPISPRLLAMDIAAGDTNAIYLFQGMQFAFIDYKMTARVSRDTIYMEAGEPIHGKKYTVRWNAMEDVTVRQRYETSVSFSPGGSHHHDLRKFMHGYTAWEKSEPTDSVYTIFDWPESVKTPPFPAVTTGKLKAAVREVVGAAYPDLIRKITTPNVDPCRVVPSAIILEISGTHKINKAKQKKIIVIEIPMGC